MFKWIVLSMILVWFFYYWLDEFMNGPGSRGTGHRQS